MTTHTGYKPARMGLLDSKTMEEKRERLMKNLCAPMVGDELLECVKAEMQHKHLSYSDLGDFTSNRKGA